ALFSDIFFVERQILNRKSRSFLQAPKLDLQLGCIFFDGSNPARISLDAYHWIELTKVERINIRDRKKMRCFMGASLVQSIERAILIASRKHTQIAFYYSRIEVNKNHTASLQLESHPTWRD
ncbi:MAG: hypothetical protein J2P21_32455, partial [Chloracidobacterium sp.]|nr:hypothetical protein [Chloracidobacterium sp.]